MANITTTSRYLRSTPLRFARAMSLLEDAESRLFPHDSHIRPIRSPDADRTNPWNRLILEEDVVVSREEVDRSTNRLR